MNSQTSSILVILAKRIKRARHILKNQKLKAMLLQ